MLGIAIVAAALVTAGAWAGPPQTMLATSFEGDLEGWTLQLNRGAKADLSYLDDAVMGKQSLRVQPTLLCAPDDQPYSTNVHLFCDRFELQAGHLYVVSVWAKAETAKRPFFLGGRRADAAVSLGNTPCEATDYWQRFRYLIQPAEDIPDFRLQIICGADLRPIMLDAAGLTELPGEPLLPADYIAWERTWAKPEMWEGDRVETTPETPLVRVPGSARFAVRLPGSYAVHMALRSQVPASVLIGPEGANTNPVDLPGGAAVSLVNERGAADPAPGPAKDRLEFVVSGGPVDIIAMQGFEMLPPRSEGATEKQEYADAETGARIIRLTHSPYNDKHAYYDVSPWSPDGSQMLFCSALPDQRASTVWLVGADGTNMHKIADSDTWGAHTGNFPVWAHDGRSVYFRTHQEVDGERVYGTARVWLDDLRQDFMTAAVRQVCPADGRLLETVSTGDAPGLYSYAPDGSDRKLLASINDLLALSPSKQIAGDLTLNLQNCKWTQDGSKCFVVFAGRDDRGRAKFVEVYTMRADGSDLHYALTMSHHPIWHPNGEQVIFNWTDGLYIVNWDGTGQRKISDCREGHPSFSPDGSLIATDGFGGDWRDAIILISPETGEARKLCGVPTIHGRSHETGTHPHPYWAPDGESLIYDSDETGHCQLYQVFVGEIGDELRNG